jgi:hypothetical protein
MKCGSTIINVVTGERYWDRRTETRPIVFPAKKWSSLQFFHFVGVSDGTDFVRIRHIFYSVQQVKLTTVWELRKYWQTLNVQKISSTGSKLYQQNSSGRTGYFFQSAEDGEVAQRDDILVPELHPFFRFGTKEGDRYGSTQPLRKSVLDMW